ncbi:MAG: hypothetical protein CMH27_02190 [Micavibrio sp.]|nr:hypothetical protein [Micavibrio sp.]|tara:strand:+ start:2001 stop:2381 length:381 start_codon:yes stop_codon:yes gene_type:complete
MDVTPLVKEGSKIIQSYAGGRFRVSGEVHEGAILVSQDSVRSWSANGPVQELTEQDFEVLITMQDEFDVVLLGTGKVLRFLAPELKAALKQKGLHVEVMDSGAACRTYNVLMAEGRRVVAAMLPHE